MRYRKNDVFLVSVCLVNANGNVVRFGAVKMKCYLFRTPELRLGLNDQVMFESSGRSDVRLYRFETRTASFIPPDGEFELMSYQLSTPVKPLVWVEAAVSTCTVAGMTPQDDLSVPGPCLLHIR